MAPSVSIIIPAYNASATLEETLRSASACTYHPLEIIVIDDGSTDNTLEIARRHAGQDSRVRVLHQENSGVCRARNHAVSEAGGEYIRSGYAPRSESRTASGAFFRFEERRMEFAEV